MDGTTAKTSYDPAIGLDREIGALFSVIATVPDDDLRRRLDRAVGDVMGAVARGLIFPIERLHPALRPSP